MDPKGPKTLPCEILAGTCLKEEKVLAMQGGKLISIG